MQVYDKLFIGGDYVASSGTETIEVINASTEEVAGRTPEATTADIDRAVAAARTAFDDGPWSRTSPAERAELVGQLREEMWSVGRMVSAVRKGKKTEGEKFKDYFDFSEPLNKLPSHRILAMFRGEKEEILELQMKPDAQVAVAGVPSSYELKIMQRFAISNQGRPGDRWLVETVQWAWRTKIQVHLNIDLRMRLWTAAETEAVRVFASNLRDLLLAAPAGARGYRHPASRATRCPQVGQW